MTSGRCPTCSALGTPSYMAPEQRSNPSAVDQQADIYSLGVVFYEMLTGELPSGTITPPSRKTPMDPRVDEVVLRAMARQKEDRYRTPAEIRTCVENITNSPAPLPSTLPEVPSAAPWPIRSPSDRSSPRLLRSGCWRCLSSSCHNSGTCHLTFRGRCRLLPMAIGSSVQPRRLA
jgi:serine/threonine protein kinase